MKFDVRTEAWQFAVAIERANQEGDPFSLEEEVKLLEQLLARAVGEGERTERAEWFRLESETVFVTCPHCGAGNEKDSGFHCRMCGTLLDEANRDLSLAGPRYGDPQANLTNQPDAVVTPGVTPESE